MHLNVQVQTQADANVKQKLEEYQNQKEEQLAKQQKPHFGKALKQQNPELYYGHLNKAEKPLTISNEEGCEVHVRETINSQEPGSSKALI